MEAWEREFYLLRSNHFFFVSPIIYSESYIYSFRVSEAQKYFIPPMGYEKVVCFRGFISFLGNYLSFKQKKNKREKITTVLQQTCL